MSETAHQDREPRRLLLITGATGFIGGRLLSEALDRGYRVRALVRNRGRIAGSREVEVFEGDLTAKESLVGVEADVDVAIHSAGLLGKWGVREGDLRAVNVQGSLNLLERFRGAPLGRFIHLSAGGVTGPLRREAADETYLCRPSTPYERSKYRAEEALLDRSRRYGIPTVVLRPTFTYGPGDPHKLGMFRAIARRRFALIAGGRNVLHPIFVDDLIAGIFLAVEHARPGEVYILGGPRPVTTRELVEAIADALGVPRPWLSVPRPIAMTAAGALEALGQMLRFEPILTRARVMMMADDFGYSIEKARRELGYEPPTNLQDGIRRAVDAYRAAKLL